MASGTKTILLSRWRTGGQSSFEIVREFAQELPHTSPADAWQRAVLVTADTRLDPAAEPPRPARRSRSPPKGVHPFFWAGYMLVDSGVGPTPVAGGPGRRRDEAPGRSARGRPRRCPGRWRSRREGCPGGGYDGRRATATGAPLRTSNPWKMIAPPPSLSRRKTGGESRRRLGISDRAKVSLYPLQQPASRDACVDPYRRRVSLPVVALRRSKAA